MKSFRQMTAAHRKASRTSVPIFSAGRLALRRAGFQESNCLRPDPSAGTGKQNQTPRSHAVIRSQTCRKIGKRMCLIRVNEPDRYSNEQAGLPASDPACFDISCNGKTIRRRGRSVNIAGDDRTIVSDRTDLSSRAYYFHEDAGGTAM